MDSLRIEIPGIERKKQAEEFIKEFTDNNSSLDGSLRMDREKTYENWLDYVNSHKNEKTLPHMHVITSVYFAIRESDDRIIGVFNIRHYLNDVLKTSGNGNIGYCVRPSERRKGYATQILGIALNECVKLGMDRAHVSCYKFNEASQKVILKNKGVLYKKHKRDDGIFIEYIIELIQKD